MIRYFNPMTTRNKGRQLMKVAKKQRGQVVKGAGVVIQRSRVQGLHPATSGVCFSVVMNSNLLSRFVNSQLVCLLPVVIFNSVPFI